jgi:hypothetical protein
MGPAGPVRFPETTRQAWPPAKTSESTAMHRQLHIALADAEPLVAARGWQRPPPAAIDAAERLLGLLDALPAARPPQVQVEPDGTISFEWEAADHGWLTLTVDDQGRLTHNAVLGEDEFTQTEAFDDALPDWAATLLQRLLSAGH